jgi:hypothetical protein
MSCLPTPLFKRSPWLGPVLAAGAALMLFCLGVLFPSAWLPAGVYHLRPYFSDLHAVLAANDAVAAGADPFAVPNPFDVMGRPHVYGPAWLSLHDFGLTCDHTALLGALLLLGTMSVGAIWLAPRTLADTVLTATWLAAPPFLLAYERGNTDLVILLLFALIGLAGKSARGLGQSLVSVVLMTATLLKFYPVAGFLALLAAGSRRTCIGRLLLWAGVTALLVAWQWPFFVAALRVTPAWSTVYGFGLPVVAHFFKLLPDALPWFFTGAILALVSLGAVWRQTPYRGWLVALQADPVAAQWLSAAGGAWIACFVALGNFPYRVVLLLPVVAAWLRVGRATQATGRSARYWGWLGAATAWLLSPYCNLLCSHALGFRQIGYVVAGLMHTLSIGLTLFIAGLILGWLRDRWNHAHE